ncbi:MAG: 4Fe-4S binding protein, partial [Actinobacteria bacterium]|nr:4Fe-4S binding protein [Actinomycetota bacterium]
MIENLNNFLKKYNYRAGIISFGRIKEVENEINDLYKNKYIDERIFKLYLNNFSYNIAEDSFKLKSIIIVAAPRPQHRLYFNTGKKSFAVLIPPTYIGLGRMDQKIKAILDCYLLGTGYMVLPARLPEKLMAAYCGLSRYGRNNISYTRDFGSFFSLTSFFSNIDCDYDRWNEKKELEYCMDCKACLKSCPTGAISVKRFLIHAERCLTFLNEKQGDFPIWIKPESHNCLVGCMKCQIICPYNEPFINWIEDAGEFTAEETEILLQNLPAEKLPSSIIEKLNFLDLQGYVGVIPRN